MKGRLDSYRTPIPAAFGGEDKFHPEVFLEREASAEIIRRGVTTAKQSCMAARRCSRYIAVRDPVCFADRLALQGESGRILRRMHDCLQGSEKTPGCLTYRDTAKEKLLSLQNGVSIAGHFRNVPRQTCGYFREGGVSNSAGVLKRLRRERQRRIKHSLASAVRQMRHEG